MIKHMFKLVWNRKRANALIIVEIFFSFLVLFAVMLLAVYYADNYRHPLGFDYANVWSVEVGSTLERESGALGGDSVEQLPMLLRVVQGLPEVESAALVDMIPFRIGASQSDYEINGRRIEKRLNGASEGFDKTMRLSVVEGRWFQPGDEALHYDPVVINRSLRNEVFGNADAVGKRLRQNEAGREMRVIGVITDFRQHGEFHGLYNYLFTHSSPLKRQASRWANMVIRTRPGTQAAFEAKLMETLQRAAPDRTFKAETLAKARISHLKFVTTPVVIIALIAAFLTIMVALGMVGVLWQTVTRRSREIGLRRAVGSPANGIYKQILGELLVVASVALALAVMLVIQVPLLELANWFRKEVYFAAMALTIAAMYALTLMAGLYPSWTATKVEPAEVLRYE